MPSLYNAHSRIVDRQIDELIDLAKGVIADGDIAQQEAGSMRVCMPIL